MAAQTFSMNELSGLMGVTRITVDRWVKQGCPFVAKANRDRGKEWQFSLPDVIEWRERLAVERAIGNTKSTTIEDARLRKTAAEAALAELELSKQRREVASLEVMASVVGDQLSACKARLMTIATKVSPLVAVTDDVNECRDIIDGAVREALDELSGYGGEGYEPGGDARPGDDEADDIGEDEAAAEFDGEPVG